MGFASWLRNRTAKRTARRRIRHQTGAQRFRPQIEPLEDRLVPSSGPTILKVNSLADSTKGNTLRNAITLADSNTNKTYEIDITVPGTILLESSLPDLKANITIVGLGMNQTAIQRDNLAVPFRILTVDAGWTAGLSALAMVDGNAGSGNGGALDNFGNLTLTNCLLAGNSADTGGAVANENGANLTVSACTFVSNISSDTTEAQGGGAIRNFGVLTVQGSSSFSLNHASSEGGAIFNNGSLTANAVSFTGNTADLAGGALFNAIDASLATVSGCTFSGNHADNGFGGAIENYATVVVTGSTFSASNSAQNGGAIGNFGTLTVQGNSNFTGNTASNAGGAISNSGTATLSQTSFGDGTAAGSNTAPFGGAIINLGGASLTLNAGASFYHNSAVDFGGAIENALGANLTATGANFSGNTGLGGGAINNSGTVTVTGASFTNNVAGNGGGIASDGTATVSGCTFIGNQAPGTASIIDGGGALWNGATGTLTVQGNSLFAGNTAVQYGGAIFNFGTATVSQAMFGDGTTPGQNSAADGGAIMNWFSGATLTLNAGVSFNDNSVTQSGGAIWNYGTIVDNGASYANNSASFFGGAIYNSPGARLDATGASFTSNTALDGGGVINYSFATFAGCTFTTNQSTGTGNAYDGGGAIWSEGTLAVQSNCSFLSNTAVAVGGAIFNFTNGVAATVTISQSAFDSNSADNGGAIWNSSGTTMIVNAGSTFTNNGATQFGGAIENQGTLSASGATFASNHAQVGGAIFNRLGAATLTTCGFSGNMAGVSGGALGNFQGAVTLSGCQLTSNSAALGGAIENDDGVLNVVAGCDISFNSATDPAGVGGGIYTFDAGTTNIIDSVVEGNGPDDTHTVTSDGSLLNVINSIVSVQTNS